MADDAPWYEAALLVGVTNALNVVADSPLASLEPASPSAEAQAVFAEIFRVLRPGGRLQFADIANGRPVPAGALRDIDLWTG